MAKAEFMGYGKGKEDFIAHKDGKIAAFVEKSGGDVGAYGDMEKKDKSSIDMNAAEAFAKKSFTEVDAEGSDYPKKSGSQVEFKDDHFMVEEVEANGNYAGKSKSNQSDKRK